MVGERAYARARALLLLHSALSARVLAHARHLRFFVSSAPLARLSSSTFCWKKGGGRGVRISLAPVRVGFRIRVDSVHSVYTLLGLEIRDVTRFTRYRLVYSPGFRNRDVTRFTRYTLVYFPCTGVAGLRVHAGFRIRDVTRDSFCIHSYTLHVPE